MDNFTDDLDLNLLDDILDALATQSPSSDSPSTDSSTYESYQPSFQILQQFQLEFSPEYQQQLFAIHDTTNWSLCKQELVACPILCLYCQSQYCHHITDQYSPIPAPETPVVSVWNDQMLASFAMQEYLLALETGLYN